VGISPVTVKRYVEILKALYIVYTVTPYTKKISRSILKEQKLYFYDTGLIKGDEGVVFENLVGNALLKHVYFKRDTMAFQGELHYLKNKEKKEVDFVLTDDSEEPELMVEVKLGDKNLSAGLRYFGEKYQVKGVQVVKNLARGERKSDLFELREAGDFLRWLKA
jgi:predicted AAA+ superfamily ATPase